MSLCACGCGQEARPGRRYIKNHYQMMKNAQRASKLRSSGAEHSEKQPPQNLPFHGEDKSKLGTPDTLRSSTRMRGAGQRDDTSVPAPIDAERLALLCQKRLCQRNDKSVPAPTIDITGVSGTAFSMFLAAGAIQFVNLLAKYSPSDMKWSGVLYLFLGLVSVFMYFRSRKEKTARPDKFPGKLLSTNEIRDTQIKQQEEKLTDEQKYLRFFSSLPKWTHQKPGTLQLKLAKWKTGNEFDMRLCVFVDDNGDNRQVYLPYNPDIGVLFTDTGFYDVPVGAGEPIFLDKAKFAPLVNRKQYKDDFDLPEDFAASLINTGIGYGRLSQFKDLIAEIKKLTTTQWIAFIGLLAVIIFMVYFVYSTNKHYGILADQVGNLTAAIKARGG